MATKKRPEPKRTTSPSAPKAKGVTFKIHAEAGSEVFVAGDFNQWDPAATALTENSGTGDFSVTVFLLPGRYEYKFVVNNTWSADPDNPEWVKNGVGTLNSVRKV